MNDFRFTHIKILLIRSKLCAPEKIASVEALIDETINLDIAYQSQPLDLRNQRTYAVKVIVSGTMYERKC